MTERAKLDSETQTVGRPPLRPHQGEIFGAEDKVAVSVSEDVGSSYQKSFAVAASSDRRGGAAPCFTS
jgi:hypothetical protein